MQSQEQTYSSPYSCDQCCFVVAFLLLNVAYWKKNWECWVNFHYKKNFFKKLYQRKEGRKIKQKGDPEEVDEPYNYKHFAISIDVCVIIVIKL